MRDVREIEPVSDRQKQNDLRTSQLGAEVDYARPTGLQAKRGRKPQVERINYDNRSKGRGSR